MTLMITAVLGGCVYSVNAGHFKTQKTQIIGLLFAPDQSRDILFLPTRSALQMSACGTQI